MRHQEKVQIGRTGLEVGLLGVGTNPLGGLHEAIPDEVAIATLERCWENEIRYYDAAPVYGYGKAETFVGRALREKPRDDYVLETKVGRLLLEDGPAHREDVMVLWNGERLYRDTGDVKPFFDFTYDGVMKSVEASKERMGVDRFDILHIHDPDLHPQEAMDGALKALTELKRRGEISAVGCGMNQWELLADFAETGSFDCFLLAGRYTLLDQSALKLLLDLCEENEITVIAGGVYNSGILAHPDPASIGDVSDEPSNFASWKDNVTYNYVPADREVIERAARLKEVSDRHDVPLMAAAIQFPLMHPAVGPLLMGPRSPGHVDSNIEMVHYEIPHTLWDDLKDEGLIHPEAPIQPASR